MPKIISNQPKSSESKSNGTKLSDRLQNAQNASKSSPDSERSVKVLYRSECGLYAILRITENRLIGDYLLTWIANPFIFSMERLEPGRKTLYTVVINKDNLYCSCDAYQDREPEETCIHVQCLQQLEKTGKLK